LADAFQPAACAATGRRPFPKNRNNLEKWLIG